MRIRALAAMALAGLALSSIAVPTASAKPPEKVAACHYDAITGSYSSITIKASAVGAHLAHGDGLPGDGEFDASCQQVVVPVVFARAWSNVDGVPGYQAGGTDMLIAELRDTQGGGASLPELGAGDILLTYRYPLDIGMSAFGTFGVTSHVLDLAGSGGSPTDLGATDLAGNIYLFRKTSDVEVYSERTPGATEGSIEVSYIADFLGSGGGDGLSIGASSPSTPQTSVFESRSGSGDDPFINLEFPFGE